MNTTTDREIVIDRIHFLQLVDALEDVWNRRKPIYAHVETNEGRYASRYLLIHLRPVSFGYQLETGSEVFDTWNVDAPTHFPGAEPLAVGRIFQTVVALEAYLQKVLDNTEALFNAIREDYDMGQAYQA